MLYILKNLTRWKREQNKFKWIVENIGSKYGKTCPNMFENHYMLSQTSLFKYSEMNLRIESLRCQDANYFWKKARRCWKKTEIFLCGYVYILYLPYKQCTQMHSWYRTCTRTNISISSAMNKTSHASLNEHARKRVKKYPGVSLSLYIAIYSL